MDKSEIFALASKPIGSQDLQQEAASIHARGVKPSAELKEAGKRAAKLWRPEGVIKKPAIDRHAAAQMDIEDAIVAAGGKRGGQALQ